jgi:glycosyltransferase involved in cell wall biosynthesis
VGLVPNEATEATELMLPTKMLEYVCLGIPVIASSLRTIRHYFPANAVRYFQPSSPSSLAESLLDLYLDPEERRVLARRASEATKHMSWERQRQVLYKAIEPLVGE